MPRLAFAPAAPTIRGPPTIPGPSILMSAPPVSRTKDAVAKERTTLSGEPIKALYGPEDVRAHDANISKPGEYPFTRGVYPTMYRGRLWTMRQFAGFGTAEETNER